MLRALVSVRQRLPLSARAHAPTSWQTAQTTHVFRGFSSLIAPASRRPATAAARRPPVVWTRPFTVNPLPVPPPVPPPPNRLWKHGVHPCLHASTCANLHFSLPFRCLFVALFCDLCLHSCVALIPPTAALACIVAAAGGAVVWALQYEVKIKTEEDKLWEDDPNTVIDQPLAEYVHPYFLKPWWWQCAFTVRRMSYLTYLFFPLIMVFVYARIFHRDDPDWRQYA
jgi:hypothetical protein